MPKIPNHDSACAIYLSPINSRPCNCGLDLLYRDHDRLLREVDLLNDTIRSLRRQLEGADTRIKLLEVELEFKNDQINRNR